MLAKLEAAIQVMDKKPRINCMDEPTLKSECKVGLLRRSCRPQPWLRGDQ